MIWYQLEKYSEIGCPIMCEKVTYDIRMTQLAENAMSTSENLTMLYAKYANSKVKIEEEYILMGTNAIISATGGSLGLFLGFSCYGAIWNILKCW